MLVEIEEEERDRDPSQQTAMTKWKQIKLKVDNHQNQPVNKLDQ